MAKYYEQWNKELTKMGYTLSAEGTVFDALGNSCAGEDRFGQAWCKDPNINELTSKGVPVVEVKPVETKKFKAKKKD